MWFWVVYGLTIEFQDLNMDERKIEIEELLGTLLKIV